MDQWITILGIIILIARIAWSAYKKSNYLDKGRLENRADNFVEYIVDFTLLPVPDEQYLAAVEAANLTEGTWVSISGNAQAIYFERNGIFKAVLYLLERTQEKSVYRFEFVEYRHINGLPAKIEEMNVILTGIEDMFMRIDSNVQITRTRRKFKKN